MAVASLESYHYCFEQVEKACNAIERGEANTAAFILCSVRDDAKFIQGQSKKYLKGLQRFETKQQKTIENLTAKINDLNDEEKRYSKQERDLGIRKKVLLQSRKHEKASKMVAEQRYRDAQEVQEKHLKEQRERDEKYENWWWLLGYNVYLAVEDRMKNNRQKARDASGEMERHQRKICDAEKKMSRLSDEEAKVGPFICEMIKAERLKHLHVRMYLPGLH